MRPHAQGSRIEIDVTRERRIVGAENNGAVRWIAIGTEFDRAATARDRTTPSKRSRSHETQRRPTTDNKRRSSIPVRSILIDDVVRSIS